MNCASAISTTNTMTSVINTSATVKPLLIRRRENNRISPRAVRCAYRREAKRRLRQRGVARDGNRGGLKGVNCL